MRLAVLSFLFAFLSSQAAYSVSINDIEIEGIQVNKNILNYYNLNLVQQNEIKKSLYKIKKYKISIFKKNLKKYDQLGVHYDMNYNIVGVSGSILYRNKNNNCLAKEKEIVDQFLSSGFKIEEGKPGRLYGSDANFKNSKFTNTTFKVDDGVIRVICSFLDSKIKKEYNLVDSLRVIIINKDYSDWIDNEAY